MYCNTFLRIAFYFYGATHCSSKVDSLYLLQMGHSFHLEEQTTTQTLFLPVKKNTNTFLSSKFTTANEAKSFLEDKKGKEKIFEDGQLRGCVLKRSGRCTALSAGICRPKLKQKSKVEENTQPSFTQGGKFECSYFSFEFVLVVKYCAEKDTPVVHCVCFVVTVPNSTKKLSYGEHSHRGPK